MNKSHTKYRGPLTLRICTGHTGSLTASQQFSGGHTWGTFLLWLKTPLLWPEELEHKPSLAGNKGLWTLEETDSGREEFFSFMISE